jgi:hypothetical protein
LGRLLPGRVDKNPSHGLGRGGEEMAAALPVLVAAAHQAEVRLVNERRALQGLSGSLTRQHLGGQESQFLVDYRKQLARLRITPFNGVKDLGDIAHALLSRLQGLVIR